MEQKRADSNAYAGECALLVQAVRLARADLNHVHGHSCQYTRNAAKVGAERCDVKQTAADFLRDLRTGNAGLWSDWLSFFKERAGWPEYALDDLLDDTVNKRSLPRGLGITPKRKSRVVLAAQTPEERRQNQLKSRFQTGHLGFTKARIETYATERGLFTAEQAAAYMGLGRNALYLRVQRNDIPIADRRGPAKLFRQSDLDAAMQAPWFKKARAMSAGLRHVKRVQAEALVEAVIDLSDEEIAAIAAIIDRLMKEEVKEERTAEVAGA